MANTQTVVMKDIKAPSMAKAIRAKCLDCCGGQFVEVRQCWAVSCPLFPYRFGRNPKAAINSLKKRLKVKLI